MRKLLSVIVPVYNVEKYLKQCVDSIIKQTYKELEIILVDDGSTDSSGQMCEQYKEIDKRIKVVHKENGGLSDARNVGVSVATGEYIAFVDSDDCIHKDMYSILIELLEKYDADMAFAKWQEFFDEIPLESHDTEEVLVLDGIEGLEFLIYGKEPYHITLSVWDRVYKRALVELLQFPKGKCYEDVVWSTEVFSHAKKAVYIDRSMYYYRRRSASITGVDISKGISNRVLTDQIPQMEAQIDYLKSINQLEMADEITFYLYEVLLKYYSECNEKRFTENKKKIRLKILNYRNWAKEYLKKDILLFRRVLVLMSIYAFPIVVMMIAINNWRKGK